LYRERPPEPLLQEQEKRQQRKTGRTALPAAIGKHGEEQKNE
jgi:hypothetical protein